MSETLNTNENRNWANRVLFVVNIFKINLFCQK